MIILYSLFPPYVSTANRALALSLEPGYNIPPRTDFLEDLFYGKTLIDPSAPCAPSNGFNLSVIVRVESQHHIQRLSQQFVINSFNPCERLPVIVNFLLTYANFPMSHIRFALSRGVPVPSTTARTCLASALLPVKSRQYEYDSWRKMKPFSPEIMRPRPSHTVASL